MRSQLRDLSEQDYWVYGPRIDDLDHVVSLATTMVAAQRAAMQLEADRIRREQPQEADDILDDVGYYAGLDTFFTWHFALWRMQGIFEGLMVYRYLGRRNSNSLAGFGRKLQEIERAGYTIGQDDREELRAWARLRNALSHAPPESFGPGPLGERDIHDYHALLKRVLRDWELEFDSQNRTEDGCEERADAAVQQDDED